MRETLDPTTPRGMAHLLGGGRGPGVGGEPAGIPVVEPSDAGALVDPTAAYDDVLGEAT